MIDQIFNTVYGRIQIGSKATVEDVITYLAFRKDYEETVSRLNLKEAEIKELDEIFPSELIEETVKEIKNRRKKQIKLQIEELQLELSRVEK